MSPWSLASLAALMLGSENLTTRVWERGNLYIAMGSPQNLFNLNKEQELNKLNRSGNND